MMNSIGKWKIIKELGKGANGKIFYATDGKQNLALKTLIKFSKSKSYARFKDEISALAQTKSIKGIIDIIEYHIPDTPSKTDLPYYIMPIAQPLEIYLKGKNHEVLFDLFLKISNTLVELHRLEYTHRDIKPNNILVIDGEPFLSDFGLVSFPEKTLLSDRNERIGPVWTIAPEMKRTSSTAEFKKADIYSLAKTLWILITGKPFGFEGQYVHNSSISLDKFVDLEINTVTIAGQWHYFSIVLLERLLVNATDNDPNKRPSAQEFYDALAYWLKSNDDYNLRNAYEWEEALKVIFPYGIPSICQWNGHEEILNVLSILTSYDNLNYCFLPERGGDSLTSVGYYPKSSYFILNGDVILKSNKLIFYFLGHPEWSYFRFVIDKSKPSSQSFSEAKEEYKVDDNFNYIGEYNDEDFEGRRISRYFEGSIIIIQKTSIINKLRGRYNGHFKDGHSGLHDKISYDEYNSMLSQERLSYISLGISPQRRYLT